MAVKKKISKVKQSNIKKHKTFNPAKSGPKNERPHKKKVERKAKSVKKQPQVPEHTYSDDSDFAADIMDMCDEDDLVFIKNAVENRSYSFLANPEKKRGKGRKNEALKAENDTLERNYEDQEVPEEDFKVLLPIKSKSGLIMRTVPKKEESQGSEEEAEDSFEQSYEEMEVEEGSKPEFVEDGAKPMSEADLLAQRHKTLCEKKIQIGVLSSALLENPEEKILNFKTLIALMLDDTPEVYLTVRKLATVSLLEVFKDLLPSYQIKHQETPGVKLKKDTFKLQKFESTLLLYYRNYLKKLEKYSLALIRKRGDGQRRSPDAIKLGELAVQCMCDLLIEHPNFNFAPNMAQVVVPHLNNRFPQVRAKVNEAVKTIFKEDKRGELTLKIMRLINQYMKTHSHTVNPDMLNVFLSLRIKDVNLEQEKENELKQKKLMNHKKRVLQLSKKEKKRQKQLDELNKELLETKAEESKQKKQENLTEITKTLFTIYFRILKNSSNPKVLGACLEGLAKFAHCINFDFFADLVNVLDKLLKEDWLTHREQLHCIQTVLVILSGYGEALNIDPSRFYVHLYQCMARVHAGRTHRDIDLAVGTLITALIKRRKKVTQQRLVGFAKRLATLALSQLHNGALAYLAIIKCLMHSDRSTDVLLDLDPSAGGGRYDRFVEDPEFCSASGTGLYELILLMKHYHPDVRKFAKNVAFAAPPTGNGALEPELAKKTPDQLVTEYDSTSVAFNPPVQPPGKCAPKKRRSAIGITNAEFRAYCKSVSKKSLDLQDCLYINIDK